MNLNYVAELSTDASNYDLGKIWIGDPDLNQQ